jgi:EAL domain-containing protein (putative c-di-GMP-specific phosphodiesterase class I)
VGGRVSGEALIGIGAEGFGPRRWANVQGACEVGRNLAVEALLGRGRKVADRTDRTGIPRSKGAVPGGGASEEITGLEALIRWQHPELGLVPPDKFIGISEKSGLILPIGEWVLRTACSQARIWQDDGLLAVPVAVNVSAVQFRQEGFCSLVRKVLLETGLPPQYLELELTESLLLSNEDVMFSVLRELREMGLTLAIDDFGTGYSSLSYLRQFPINMLKIDRSFIRHIATNSGDAAITTAIISLAKGLNLKVIAEGVEDEAQLAILRERQCDEIQGYYFSKPVSVAEVPSIIERSHLRNVRRTGDQCLILNDTRICN